MIKAEQERSKKKKLLVIVSGIFLLLSALETYGSQQVRATHDERTLAGDSLIPQPIGSVDHAVTIRQSPHDVWPWLVQMGSGRAGWYAYDFIDNGSMPSAEQILPEFQNIEAGDVFPALPGATNVFVVVEVEPERSLVLAWRSAEGRYLTTWAFILEPRQPNFTRLIVRGRVAAEYHPYGLPQWLALVLARPTHFLMERKQLLGIRKRVEATPQ
jgi:hypothetical protein